MTLRPSPGGPGQCSSPRGPRARRRSSRRAAARARAAPPRAAGRPRGGPARGQPGADAGLLWRARRRALGRLRVRLRGRRRRRAAQLLRRRAPRRVRRQMHVRVGLGLGHHKTHASTGHRCARAALRRHVPLPLTPRVWRAGRWCRAARTRSCWCWTCARPCCRPTRPPGCGWATARRSPRRQARARAASWP